MAPLARNTFRPLLIDAEGAKAAFLGLRNAESMKGLFAPGDYLRGLGTVVPSMASGDRGGSGHHSFPSSPP